MQYTNIGRCLKVAQALRDVKNIDLAREVGVKPQQVIRWRNSQDMNFHRVQWFPNRFDMTLSEFLGLDDAKG